MIQLAAIILALGSEGPGSLEIRPDPTDPSKVGVFCSFSPDVVLQRHQSVVMTVIDAAGNSLLLPAMSADVDPNAHALDLKFAWPAEEKFPRTPGAAELSVDGSVICRTPVIKADIPIRDAPDGIYRGRARLSSNVDITATVRIEDTTTHDYFYDRRVRLKAGEDREIMIAALIGQSADLSISVPVKDAPGQGRFQIRSVPGQPASVPGDSSRWLPWIDLAGLVGIGGVLAYLFTRRTKEPDGQLRSETAARIGNLERAIEALQQANTPEPAVRYWRADRESPAESGAMRVAAEPVETPAIEAASAASTNVSTAVPPPQYTTISSDKRMPSSRDALKELINSWWRLDRDLSEEGLRSLIRRDLPEAGFWAPVNVSELQVETYRYRFEPRNEWTGWLFVRDEKDGNRYYAVPTHPGHFGSAFDQKLLKRLFAFTPGFLRNFERVSRVSVLRKDREVFSCEETGVCEMA